jgi:serine/threonine protein kinase
MKDIYIDILGPGRCDIVEKKQGGFGDVLMLSQGGCLPSHAIKFIESNKGSKDGLLSEVSRLANLPPHANIVEIEACTETELGTGILMPYYPMNMRDLMRDKTGLDKILSMGTQIAVGLQHLHEHGVLHLDLKPENVLISSDRTVVLSDFGISKAIAKPDLKDNPNLEITMPTISGTLWYMAPEQLLATVVSVKTDVFAFGTILYESVTGHLPFSGNTVAAYAKSLLYSPVRFSVTEHFRLRGWLKRLICHCLEKTPDRRPTPAEVIEVMRTHRCGFSRDLHSEDHFVREINRAGSLAKIGERSAALAILQAVIVARPWNITARTNMAELYFEMGNVDKAIELAQVAYDLIPWCPEQAGSEQVTYLNLAFYLMTRDPQCAYSLTKRALLRYPDNWELLHNHAETCRLISIDSSSSQTKIVEEGISCAEKALTMNPKDESLRITYAGLLRLGKKRERFIPYLNDLMKDVGEHSVAARLLFLHAHIDEGNLDFVEKQIRELSQIEAFDCLLEEPKKRLKELRQTWKAE